MSSPLKIRGTLSVALCGRGLAFSSGQIWERLTHRSHQIFDMTDRLIHQQLFFSIEINLNDFFDPSAAQNG